MVKKRPKKESTPGESVEDSDESMSARSLSDNVIEALKQDDVAAAIGKVVGPIIQETVAKLLETINMNLKQLIDDNKKLADNVNALNEENKVLKARLSMVEGRVEVMERESRQNSIVIRGLPEKSYREVATATGGETETRHESVVSNVIEMCQQELNVTIEPEDIAEAFRMRAGPKDKCRPVLVKFSSPRIRQQVMVNKKNLRNSNKNIYISEHLTKPVADMFAKARALVKEKKLFGAWSFKGQLYVKKSTEATARGVLIKSINELQF